MVATMERRDTMPREEREQRERERDIDVGERGLTVIVCWEAVVDTSQGESRREKNKKVGIKIHHCATTEEIMEFDVSKEEMRGSGRR